MLNATLEINVDTLVNYENLLEILISNKVKAGIDIKKNIEVLKLEEILDGIYETITLPNGEVI
jgi:L-2-hydroxyglutarate oxidase LhgO